MLQTDYKHLHLTTIIIIITVGEFYSPSRNLRFVRSRFDFRVWFKGGFVYTAVLWDKLWWLVSSSPSCFKTKCIVFSLQCICKTIPVMPLVMWVFSKMPHDLYCPMPQRVAGKCSFIRDHMWFWRYGRSGWKPYGLLVIYSFSLFESLTTCLNPNMFVALYLKPKTKHSITIVSISQWAFWHSHWPENEQILTPVKRCRSVCVQTMFASQDYSMLLLKYLP